MPALFAEVILPLPLSRYFTYQVPASYHDTLEVGMRVLVSFGKSKQYTAIVVSLHQHPSTEFEIKPLLEVLDTSPILRHPQLKLWEWIASYYMCSIGEVYKAAVPAGMKLESETYLSYHEDFEEDEAHRLSDRERQILDILAQSPRMKVSELNKAMKVNQLIRPIRKLMDCQAIILSEEVKQAYKPKLHSYVRMTLDREDQESLRKVFDQLAKKKKQLALLMKLLELTQFMLRGELLEVTKKELLNQAGVTTAVLKSLQEFGVVEIYQKEVSRVTADQVCLQPVNELNPYQKKAQEEILDSFREKQVTLLHGVTSSGKTEIYIHLIQQVLSLGKQALLMVPEIALTTQLSTRLMRIFGKKLAIYHSKFSDNERVEIWNRILHSDEVEVVVGVRSSVFLPFKKLGLVIVDEEHESSYKQQDPAPRYHGRNVATVLAAMHGAKTLLATATPSVESYFNALHEKYGLVELMHRHKEVKLPHITAVDIQQLKKRKEMISHFSPLLLTKMNQAAAHGAQSILFQNRRGFAPMIECQLCAWVPKCQFCDVSLTYHKAMRQLTCHYCGYTAPIPAVCPSCGHPDLTPKGFGTEKIEEEITRVLPQLKVARMDLDTTRSKRAFECIIQDFQQGKQQILVGTQMVTKGLDFEHVQVVGVLHTDGLMNYPDFRSHERAFQMLTQVAGRAGRRDQQGEVVLQTSQPDHPLIQFVIQNNYVGMYRKEISEREQFHYPPFSRLIYIYMKHKDERLLEELARKYAAYLTATFGSRVLGPDHPPVARVQSLFIRKIVLKVELEASVQRAKEILIQSRLDMMVDERFKSLLFYYDVDPV